MSDPSLKHITDASFQTDVLESRTPVLVNFYAPWCGPCRQLGPTIEGLAARFGGAVTVAKLNVDANQEIPDSLGIASLPTVFLYRNGAVVDRLVGVLPAEKYEAALASLIEANMPAS